MEVGASMNKNKMVFEETELRLGLPGNINGPIKQTQVVRKRGFSQIETVDLMLNLCPKEEEATDPHGTIGDNPTLLLSPHSTNHPAKAQVVGWPPVRSFRKNMLAAQKSSTSSGDVESEKKKSTNTNTNTIIISFVKVSMDGAPYLRKIDLKMYNTYSHLSHALGKMFSSFTIGNCESEGIKDLMKESNKLMDVLNSSDYVPTYEDKDGDWMLVGDVPWEMFVESCKRLRIMKGKEAIGLAPRAMEKCKNRT